MSSRQSGGNSILGRLWQVVLTYTQVWGFRIQIPFLVLYVIAIFFVRPRSMIARGGWGLFAVEQIVMLTVMVADHLKTQLDDWRSDLTPRFRWPHLVVATVFAGIPLCMIPVLLKGPLEVSGRGLLGFTVLISAILAWAVYSPWMAIVAGVVLALFKGGDADLFISDLMTGKLRGISTGMICSGAAALALLWILIARLNGQTSINQLTPGNAKLRPKMTMNPRNERSSAIGSFIESIMEKISKSPSPPSPRLIHSRARVRQRRLVTSGGIPPWFGGASCAIVFSAIFLLLDLLVWTGTGSGITNLLFLGALLLPLIQSWGFAAVVIQRWPLLAGESLLPATRREFVSDWGRALFWDMVEGWASCTAIAVIITFASSPHGFIGIILDIGIVIALAAAALVFIFGITLWLMRFRHQWISLFGLLVCIVVSGETILVGHLDRTDATRRAVLWFAGSYIAGLCLIGGLCLWDASRRWRRTELD